MFFFRGKKPNPNKKTKPTICLEFRLHHPSPCSSWPERHAAAVRSHCRRRYVPSADSSETGEATSTVAHLGLNLLTERKKFGLFLKGGLGNLDYGAQGIFFPEDAFQFATVCLVCDLIFPPVIDSLWHGLSPCDSEQAFGDSPVTAGNTIFWVENPNPLQSWVSHLFFGKDVNSAPQKLNNLNVLHLIYIWNIPLNNFLALQLWLLTFSSGEQRP